MTLVEHFERGLDAPICLTWELTYACNLSCVHCLSSSGRRDPRELTTAQCEAVIDEFRISKPDQEITLSIQCQTNVLIDSDRITQMLTNLVGNAIQHGIRGPVDVTLREMEPNVVTIEVHNFGPAIPAAEQPHLFEAFHRGRGRDLSSIGLGLFIANEIARAHGGRIVVRSPDRNGTTFSVALPRRYEAAA